MAKVNVKVKGLDVFHQVPKDINGMPLIRKTQRIPSGLVPFSELSRHHVEEDEAVHFFLPDQLFERVWGQCGRFTSVLCKRKFALSPDFSVFMDMPMELIAYNVWRSRLLGSWWQVNGCDVIPTVTWAGVASYDKCFSGIEPGGVVAVGACPLRDKMAANRWLAGIRELEKRCTPTDILIYGSDRLPDVSLSARVHTFPNPFIERMRRNSHGR